MDLPGLARDVTDFIYPGRCAACADDCAGSEFLCIRCAAGLENLAAEAACERCAGPVVSRGAPCPWCRGEGLYPFEKVIRLGRFTEPLRELIHALKYRGRWTLAVELAARLAAVEPAKKLLAEIDVIVPVPLHWTRRIARGYNQADLLARAVAQKCTVKYVRAVRRTRRTESQTGVHSRADREANVHGAFSLRAPKRLAGKRVLVVDDVMTTAATLQAVGRAIKSAKPATISAIVLAVADPRGQDFQAL